MCGETFKMCIEHIFFCDVSHERQLRNRDVYSMMPLRPGELTGRPVRFMSDEERVEAFYTMTTYRLV